MSIPCSIPRNYYSCSQVRELDRGAIEAHGMPGIRLMKNAGRCAFEKARELWPESEHWIVFCGGGNNGGDGYIVAALAAQKRHRVTLFYLSDPQGLKNDARTAWQFAVQEGVKVEPFSPATAEALKASGAVVVDALLGTGAQGAARGPVTDAIRWINASGLPVLALDIPSGLNGDTGIAAGDAVEATATVTFIGCKTGLVTGQGPRFTGQLYFSDLGVPAEVYQNIEPAASAPAREALLAGLPQRHADAHKGRFGHVMVIGGDHGYGGAALLASETAAVTGPGLVSLSTRPEHVTAALVRCPEVMAVGVVSGQALEPYLKRPNVLVVGPGLGQSPWSEQMLQQALATGLPLVLDADALNILSQGQQQLPDDSVPRVLTPHPGEAARLLGCTVEDIQVDRFAAIKALHRETGGVVVLKGAGTLIYDGARMRLAKVGNPGLARGGTGDVLSGLIGGLLVQGLDAMDAATLAVCIHGDAADLAVVETGIRGLLATDLIPYIRELLFE